MHECICDLHDHFRFRLVRGWSLLQGPAFGSSALVAGVRWRWQPRWLGKEGTLNACDLNNARIFLFAVVSARRTQLFLVRRCLLEILDVWRRSPRAVRPLPATMPWWELNCSAVMWQDLLGAIFPSRSAAPGCQTPAFTRMIGPRILRAKRWRRSRFLSSHAHRH